MDQDYGTLTCAGQNEVGEQANPCVFQVILAGKAVTWLLLFYLNALKCQNISQHISRERKLFRREKLFHTKPNIKLINPKGLF